MESQQWRNSTLQLVGWPIRCKVNDARGENRSKRQSDSSCESQGPCCPCHDWPQTLRVLGSKKANSTNIWRHAQPNSHFNLYASIHRISVLGGINLTWCFALKKDRRSSFGSKNYSMKRLDAPILVETVQIEQKSQILGNCIPSASI